LHITGLNRLAGGDEFALVMQYHCHFDVVFADGCLIVNQLQDLRFGHLTFVKYHFIECFLEPSPKLDNI